MGPVSGVPEEPVPATGEISDEAWLQLKTRLARSKFRSRFKLGVKELDILQRKGVGTVHSHACDFVTRRLAPAMPQDDGRQTPMRGHPVFVAQHATATCCRSCLWKWHRIREGAALTPEQVHYAVSVIMRWIKEAVT